MPISLDGSLEEVMTRYIAHYFGPNDYQSVTVTAVDCERLYAYLSSYLKSIPNAIVFEFAAGHGITTCTILKAIHDNGETARLITSERLPGLYGPLLDTLPNKLFSLICGDLKDNLSEIPHDIDFLVIDAEHTAECAEWYIEALMDRVSEEGLCFLHDMSLRTNHWRETLTVAGNLQMYCFQILHHPDEHVAPVGWTMPQLYSASFTSGMVLRRRHGPVIPVDAQ